MLPDERLQRRLELLVEQLSQAPEQSIPQACGSAYDAKAAYRFLG
jgi:transposase-like protein